MGGEVAARKRKMSTCCPLRSLKDNVLRLRSFLTPPQIGYTHVPLIAGTIKLLRVCRGLKLLKENSGLTWNTPCCELTRRGDDVDQSDRTGDISAEPSLARERISDGQRPWLGSSSAVRSRPRIRLPEPPLTRTSASPASASGTPSEDGCASGGNKDVSRGLLEGRIKHIALHSRSHHALRATALLSPAKAAVGELSRSKAGAGVRQRSSCALRLPLRSAAERSEQSVARVAKYFEESKTQYVSSGTPNAYKWYFGSRSHNSARTLALLQCPPPS
ncbi:hypothetical protein EDB83DRAFT_2552588, partial [Lactarius deliciosus]